MILYNLPCLGKWIPGDFEPSPAEGVASVGPASPGASLVGGDTASACTLSSDVSGSDRPGESALFVDCAFDHDESDRDVNSTGSKSELS